MRSWLESRGAYISPKIATSTLEDRGTSVICTEDLKLGEVIIEIPRNELLNAHTVSLRDKKLTSHQLLAAELCARQDPWIEQLPTDFSGIPLCWSHAEREELPPKYRSQAEHQLQQFLYDYEAYKLELGAAAVPLEQYKISWLQVNSRCLYWDLGFSREENMTLAPFVDFLNHTGHQELSVKVERHPIRGSMVVRAPSLQKGQEVCLNYGPHENGFLLCEYGFVETNNMWDFIDITSDIQARLPDSALRTLDKLGYAGDYTVGKHFEPSFRTQVALASMQSISRPLELFIAGYDDGSRFAKESESTLASVRSDVTKLIDAFASKGHRPHLRVLYSEYRKLLD